MGRPTLAQVEHRNRSENSGRPTLFTPETLQKLENAFAMGCTDEEACIFADIAMSTLYNHQKNNSKFLEKKKLLKNKPTLTARYTVVKALPTSPELSFKYLERKLKSEFAAAPSSNVNVNNQIAVVGLDTNKRFEMLKNYLKDEVTIELEAHEQTD